MALELISSNDDDDHDQQEQPTLASVLASLQSPVDVILAMREELAEFQRTTTKEAFREKLRKEMQAACVDALHRAADAARNGEAAGGCPSYPNIDLIVEYLRERVLLQMLVFRPKLSRARQRELEAAIEREEASKNTSNSSNSTNEPACASDAPAAVQPFTEGVESS
jgi:hypothetical protein